MLLGLTVGLAPASSGQRVQCWTDSTGQRACGDTVPPQYAQQQREIYDDQGRVRQVRPREKTSAEIAAEEKAQRDQAEAVLKAQQQRDYDRFLLGTYNRDRDIEKARDERLTQLEGRQTLIEKQLADNEKAIAQQQARVDAAGKDGKTPPPALTRKLAELQQTRDGNRQALADIAADQQKTTDKYAADLARFRELRSESDAPQGAPAGKPAPTGP
ncbi:MAG: hypothetical protein QM661_10940 [Solimonas sp.]